MTQTRAEQRAFDTEHRTITLGLLALVTMFAFEAVAVSLAMPSVARELDGETLYPIAVVGLLTAAIVGMVVGGIWSDARGASLPLTVGGVGFVAGLLVSGFAGSMEVFVGGRLLQGLGAGAALTAMYVAVGDAYPPHLRTRVFSLFADGLGGARPSSGRSSPARSSTCSAGARCSWSSRPSRPLSTFGVRGAMGRRLAVRTKPLVWGLRPLYAVIAAIGVVALHLAGHGSGLRSGLLLAVGLVVVGVAAGPLLPRGTTRASRGLPAVVASRGLFGAAFACVEMFLPLVLQERDAG